ncbi:MAG: glycosyltransferase [Chloroflexi bacterium HGW-Chloroflexi-2]|jgi:N-acetylglucosaminyldiphosphoundecaprenol N-acetyl-beta-D-mannosaminyltransferase|nr:MAG: glycosyltransferase [Chloroflexi bacterium HGW-Chloroflexi-2]
MQSNLRFSNILGVHINALNITNTLNIIENWIEQKNNNYICVTPAHSIMDCYKDFELRNIFNQSGLTTPDGMAVVWIMRLMGFKETGRVYGPDLMNSVCKLSESKGWKHFFYGSAPGVVESLKQRLSFRFPGLCVVGNYCPPFRELTKEEDDQIIQQINQSGADIIWVGISSPKQERWMYNHLGKINAPVMIGVGAAFDFLSGNKKQAPLWIQRSGFEWLYRFLQEPKRLWPRYKKYPLFIVLVLLQLLGIKDYS